MAGLYYPTIIPFLSSFVKIPTGQQSAIMAGPVSVSARDPAGSGLIARPFLFHGKQKPTLSDRCARAARRRLTNARAEALAPWCNGRSHKPVGFCRPACQP
jgi:hypothetical protein